MCFLMGDGASSQYAGHTRGVDLVLFDGEELVFGNDPRVGALLPRLQEFAANLHSSRSNNSERRCDTWEESC